MEGKRTYVAGKRCGQCGQTKPTSDFYLRRGRPSQVMSECRECARQRSQAYRDRRKTPEGRARHAAALRAYRKRRPDIVRKVNLKAAHGITPEQYEQMLTEQGGVCAACGQPEIGRNQYGPLPLAVDHNHQTGVIRGLLCMRCNRALGLLGDSAEILSALLAYLLKVGDAQCPANVA